MYQIRENIYGHLKRLEWLQSQLKKNDRVMEFGCGAGTMVTIPLIAEGYDVIGLDRDQRSIEYGRTILEKYGFPVQRLMCEDLKNLTEEFDVIIASEVFEHIHDKDLDIIMDLIHKRLKSDGKLLVTVPNGYGWFELESFAFYKLGLGPFLVKVKSALRRVLSKSKPQNNSSAAAAINSEQSTTDSYVVCPYLSTFDNSPHVQRFTRRSLRKKLADHGYAPQQIEGTVLFSGPFSDIFFTGKSSIMNLNKRLGAKFPMFASGYMVPAYKVRTSTTQV